MMQMPGQKKLSQDRRLDIIQKWMRGHYRLAELNKDQLSELDFRVYEKKHSQDKSGTPALKVSLQHMRTCTACQLYVFAHAHS